MAVDELSSEAVFEHVVGYLERNTTPRQPLGLRAPTIAGGVSCITGGTNINTVEHCLDLATERGTLVKYRDWKRRWRYAPADNATLESIVTTDDLELDTKTVPADTIRGAIGAQNVSDDPNHELIERFAELVAEAKDA